MGEQEPPRKKLPTSSTKPGGGGHRSEQCGDGHRDGEPPTGRRRKPKDDERPSDKR